MLGVPINTLPISTIYRYRNIVPYSIVLSTDYIRNVEGFCQSPEGEYAQMVATKTFIYQPNTLGVSSPIL